MRGCTGRYRHPPQSREPVMSAGNHSRVAASFDEVLSSPSEMRGRIIARVAQEDAALGDELRSLLSASDAAETYFELAERRAGPSATPRLSTEPGPAWRPSISLAT